MQRLVRLHVAVYELLLPVFPRDLRAEFREAMVLAFEEHLTFGAFAVWADVARDLVRIALPYQALRSIIPAVTLLGSFGLFCLLAWAIAPSGHC